MKGFDVSLQLAKSSIVVFGECFHSIVDHVKKTEGILQLSQEAPRSFGEFRG